MIWCDKLSTATAIVWVHPDKNEKNFDAVVIYLSQHFDKRGPTPCIKIVSIAQTWPIIKQKTSTASGTIKRKIELKKDSREEYDSMSIEQQQQLYELWHKAGLINSKKTPESSKALEARVAMLEAKRENISNKSFFADEKPKANNSNNAALERKGFSTWQSLTDSWQLGLLKGDGQFSEPNERVIKSLITVRFKVGHASVDSSNLKKNCIHMQKNVQLVITV